VVELAEIVREAGEAYCQSFGERMPPSHKRALRDILACRTPELGGSLFSCDEGCGHFEFSYHSCRNRHCPKCHRDDTQRWLERLHGRLLSCPYYFATFTIPSELRPLARSHQRVVYDLLLRQAAEALQQLADDPRWMGGKLGMLAVLHTWTRDLAYHPHVHLLVTAGGLTQGGDAWHKPAHQRFLVPGRALSKIFRAKMRDGLQHAGLLDGLDPAIFRKPWTVHLKHDGDGEHAAEYLSRYVHRVALTNDRIEAFDGERVTFRYISSRTRETRRLTLPVKAFLARFLQHVLPKGFAKIRSYGLLSAAATPRRERARVLLALDPAQPTQRRSSPAPSQPVAEQTLPPRCRPCPACRQGHLVRLLCSHRPILVIAMPIPGTSRAPPP
jgi:hypothetical protein